MEFKVSTLRAAVVIVDFQFFMHTYLFSCQVGIGLDRVQDPKLDVGQPPLHQCSYIAQSPVFEHSTKIKKRLICRPLGNTKYGL